MNYKLLVQRILSVKYFLGKYAVIYFTRQCSSVNDWWRCIGSDVSHLYVEYITGEWYVQKKYLPDCN